MSPAASVREFFAWKTIAVAGVSRNEKSMGNAVLNALRSPDRRVIPVNPAAARIGEERCYPDLASIPGPVDAVVTVVPPAVTMQVVRDAAAKGVRQVWMQLGSDSREAIAFCSENSIACISKECVLMYAEPVRGIHGFHRAISRLFCRLHP